MFAWRHRGAASRPAFRLDSWLLLGLVGCSTSPCAGDACPTASSTNEVSPTATSVDADAAAGSHSAVTSSTAETAEDLRECRVDDDCHEQAPVCSDNGQCVVCTGNEDCAQTSRPYCKVAADEKKNSCVACQKGTDCGPAGQWECVEEQCFESCDSKASASCGSGLVCVANSVQAIQYCAECGPGAACADPDLLCVNNTCLVCDPTTDTGCSSGEHCEPLNAGQFDPVDAGAQTEASAPAAKCVECRANAPEDCPNGACVDGACQVCRPLDNAGCKGDTPVCKMTEGNAGVITSVCVECVSSEDCADSPAGPHCVADRCAACDPADNSGCSGGLDTCVDIAPSGVRSLYECRECAGADSCDNGVCVDFTCVECASSQDCDSASLPECRREETDAGSSEIVCAACTTNAACEHRPNTPVCDEESGECVVCTRDADCTGTPETPACDTNEHICVECTDSTHCPDNPGGCLTFPGDGQYTCAPDATTPDELEECARCNAGECAPGLVCAEYGDDYRCLPAAAAGDACGPESLFSADDLTQVLVCIPENCAQ